MGAKISISPPLNMQTVNIKQFLTNKPLIHSIFSDVVTFNRPHVRKNRNGMNDKLAIEEILLYFAKDINSFLTNNFVCNSLVIIASFEFAIHRKRTQKSKISEKQFHSFLEAMFLFSHVWELYLVSDDNVQDEILFYGEYCRSKEKMGKMKGFSFLCEVSDEEWANEFQLIDRSKDDEITFIEASKYVTKHVVTPKKYTAAAIDSSKYVKHSDSDRRNMRVFTTKRENTQKVINLVAQLSFKVDGKMFAVDLPSGNKFSSYNKLIRSRQNTSSNLTSLRNVLDRMHDVTYDEQIKEDLDVAADHHASSLANDENVASRLSLFRLIKQKKAERRRQQNDADCWSSEDDIDVENESKQIDDTQGGCQIAEVATEGNNNVLSGGAVFGVVRQAQIAKNMISDLQRTRQRLTMRKANFDARLVPDHATKTETQKKAAHMRQLHCVPSKESMVKTAQRFNRKQEKTFAMKFPADPVKATNEQHRPPMHHNTLPAGSIDDAEASFLFVTENRLNFDNTSLSPSDLDSNYMAVETRLGAKIEEIYGDGPSCEVQPQTSLSIRVQSDFGGSIHTNSMQHLSFDRDMSRKPPNMKGDASIDLSAHGIDFADDMTLNDHNIDDDVTRNMLNPVSAREVSVANKIDRERARENEREKFMLKCADKGPMPQTHSYDNAEMNDMPKFEPLNYYARRKEEIETETVDGERVVYVGSDIRREDNVSVTRMDSAPPKLSQFNDSNIEEGSYFYGSTLGSAARPGSAPARTVNLALTPVGDVEELEKKYYPPAKQLGYYVQRAKSPTKINKGRIAERPRSTYRAPVRRDMDCAPRSPVYHSWMEPGGNTQDTRRTETMHQRTRAAPMSVKKALAISHLRRHNLNITGPRY
jgi:hypothetical protein